MIDPNLRSILLTKLDRILNPKFEVWFIRSLFGIGSILILSSLASGFLVELQVNFEWLSALIKYANEYDSAFLIVGLVFICISVLLYLRIVPSVLHARPLDDLKNNIKDLLDDLENDIQSTIFTVRQKQEIFKNKKKEMYRLLRRISADVPGCCVPTRALVSSDKTEQELHIEVESYAEEIKRLISE